MEFHEYANIFPLLEGDELAALAADIKKNGQEAPIHLYEGKILDGRNRWRACEIAGEDPWTVEYQGNDPLGFVISYNIMRRHLDTGQRAAIASKIANMPHGGDQALNLALGRVPQAKAAEMMHVSPASIRTFNTLEDPELRAEVASGTMTLNAAKKVQQALKLEASGEALKLNQAEAKEKATFLSKEPEGIETTEKAIIERSEEPPAAKINYEAAKLKLLAEAEAAEEAQVIETDYEETDSEEQPEDEEYWKERPEAILNMLKSMKEYLVGRVLSLTENYEGDHHKDNRRERELFLADDRIIDLVWEITEASTELLDEMTKLIKQADIRS